MNKPMQLTSIDPNARLLELFRTIDSSRDLACISGFGVGWDNILAFDCIEQFQLSDLSQLQGLHEFVTRHEDNLLVGYFSYDLGLLLHDLPSQFQAEQPLIQLYAYDRFLIEDEQGVKGYRIEQDELSELTRNVPESQLLTPEISWSIDMPLSDYLVGFETIQDYIRAGDIYQINYTHQLSAQTDADGRDLFAYFMQHKPVSNAAYLATNEFEIISLSPEGFIQVEGQHIVTQPIKGTRPRAENPAEDLALKEALVQSEKEQAELFMIVDLLRNDLGKVCETGSVQVTESKVVTAMPNVWHTHATIQGQLKSDTSVIDALLSMFPGGSITGCPKHRAMEVIDELEVEPRGVYTGSVGYILPSGKAAFNIAIRTMIKRADQLSLGVGGGITIKSDGQDEYAETAAKAAFFRQEQES